MIMVILIDSMLSEFGSVSSGQTQCQMSVFCSVPTP